MIRPEEIQNVKDRLAVLQEEIRGQRAKLHTDCNDIRLHLAMASVDKYLADPDVFVEDVLPNAKWEHETSYKIRKCLLSGKVIMPFVNKVFKGTLAYKGRERTIWVSEAQMVFYKLKIKHAS